VPRHPSDVPTKEIKVYGFIGLERRNDCGKDAVPVGTLHGL
jgi:hypothetical protein